MTAHADGGLQAASGNPGGRQGFATDRREAEFFGRSRGGQPAIRQESARTELPMFNVHWLQQSFDTTRGRRHGQVGRRLVPERLRPHRSSRYCTVRRLTGESRAILLSLMVSTTTAAATIRVGGGFERPSIAHLISAPRYQPWAGQDHLSASYIHLASGRPYRSSTRRRFLFPSKWLVFFSKLQY